MKEFWKKNKKVIKIASAVTTGVVVIGGITYLVIRGNQNAAIKQQEFDDWYAGLNDQDKYDYDLKKQMILLDNAKEAGLVGIITGIVNDVVDAKLNQHKASDHND